MKCYRFADINVRLISRYPYTQVFAKDFAMDCEEPELSISVSAAEIEAEQRACGRPAPYCEFVCLYRKLVLTLLPLGRFLLHASVIDYNGRGYAFLGKSGAGKSTHTELWLSQWQGKVRVINGDKPIIRMEAQNEEAPRFYAYGTPWAGKEGLYVNDFTRLDGMCFIEQAKECSIVRLKSDEVVPRLLHQLLIPRDREGVVTLMAMVDKLISTVPCYLLRCDISKEAAHLSFQALTGLDPHAEKPLKKP